MLASRAEQLDKRLQQALAEIERLNSRKQGKKRLEAEALRAAAEHIIQGLRVAAPCRITVKTRTRQIRKRKYGDRPEQVLEQSQSTVEDRLDGAASRLAGQEVMGGQG